MENDSDLTTLRWSFHLYLASLKGDLEIYIYSVGRLELRENETFEAQPKEYPKIVQ